MIDRAGSEPSAAESRANGTDGSASSPLERELAALRGEFARYASLELERVRAAGRAGMFALIAGAVATLAGATLVVASTLFVLRGAAGGLAALTTPWAGRLLGGLGALVLVWVGLQTWRRRSDARQLRKLLEREPEQDEPAAEEAS